MPAINDSAQKPIEEMKRKEMAKVMAMPVIGHGSFVWAGKPYRLPIVKMGKRDVTLRSEDGTLITFNKKSLTASSMIGDLPDGVI